MSNSSLPEVILRFDASVYRLDAIKKAAYRFSDRCFAQIKSIDVNEVEVTLRSRKSDIDPDDLIGSFSNEVLDQELRATVAAETAGIRDLLIAQAFSATTLLDNAGERASYEADPLGIARPEE